MLTIIVSNRKKLLLGVALFCLPYSVFGMELEVMYNDEDSNHRLPLHRESGNGPYSSMTLCSFEGEGDSFAHLSREDENALLISPKTQQVSAEDGIVVQRYRQLSMPLRPNLQQYLSDRNPYIKHGEILGKKQSTLDEEWDKKFSFSRKILWALDGMKDCCPPNALLDFLDPKRVQFYVETTGAPIELRYSNNRENISAKDSAHLLEIFWKYPKMWETMEEKGFDKVCGEPEKNRYILELIGSSAIFLMNHEDVYGMGEKSQIGKDALLNTDKRLRKGLLLGTDSLKCIDILFHQFVRCYSFLADTYPKESKYNYTLSKYYFEYAFIKRRWTELFVKEVKKPAVPRKESPYEWEDYDHFLDHWESLSKELDEYYEKAYVYLIKCSGLSGLIEGKYEGLDYVAEFERIKYLITKYMGDWAGAIEGKGQAYIAAANFIKEFETIKFEKDMKCFEFISAVLDLKKIQFLKMYDGKNIFAIKTYLEGVLKHIQKTLNRRLEEEERELDPEQFEELLAIKREYFGKAVTAINDLLENKMAVLDAGIRSEFRKKGKLDFGEYLYSILEKIKSNVKSKEEAAINDEVASGVVTIINNSAKEYSFEFLQKEFEKLLEIYIVEENDLPSIEYHLYGVLESILREMQEGQKSQGKKDIIEIYLQGVLETITVGWMENLTAKIKQEHDYVTASNYSTKCFDGILCMFAAKTSKEEISKIVSSWANPYHFNSMIKVGLERLKLSSLKETLENDNADEQDKEKSDNIIKKIDEANKKFKINNKGEPTVGSKDQLISMINICYDVLITCYTDLLNTPRAPEANFALGHIYQNGYKVNKKSEPEKWHELAAEHYLTAAQDHHIDAQIAVGKIYRDGRGRGKNEDEAIKYFNKVSDNKDLNDNDPRKLEARFCLAEIYQGQKQYNIAKELYNILGNYNNAIGILKIAEMYEDNQLTSNNNIALAKQKYLKAAKEGNLDAEFGYARMLEIEAAVEASEQKRGGLEKEAVKSLTEVASKGHLGACVRLGVKYRHGLGVNQDIDKAEKCFLNGALKQHCESICELGAFYLEIDLLNNENPNNYKWLEAKIISKFILEPKNKAELADRYLKYGIEIKLGEDEEQNLHLNDLKQRIFMTSADLGNLDAFYQLGALYDECLRLGRKYQNGEGVALDIKKAVKLFSMGASNKHLQSICELGALYLNIDCFNNTTTGEYEEFEDKIISTLNTEDKAELAQRYLDFGLELKILEGEEHEVQNKRHFVTRDLVYREAAKLGNNEAANELGTLYEQLGDYKEAIKAYLPAAEAQHIHSLFACSRLFTMLDKESQQSCGIESMKALVLEAMLEQVLESIPIQALEAACKEKIMEWLEPRVEDRQQYCGIKSMEKQVLEAIQILVFESMQTQALEAIERQEVEAMLDQVHEIMQTHRHVVMQTPELESEQAQALEAACKEKIKEWLKPCAENSQQSYGQKNMQTLVLEAIEVLMHKGVQTPEFEVACKEKIMKWLEPLATGKIQGATEKESQDASLYLETMKLIEKSAVALDSMNSNEDTEESI